MVNALQENGTVKPKLWHDVNARMFKTVPTFDAPDGEVIEEATLSHTELTSEEYHAMLAWSDHCGFKHGLEQAMRMIDEHVAFLKEGNLRAGTTSAEAVAELRHVRSDIEYEWGAD